MLHTPLTLSAISPSVNTLLLGEMLIDCFPDRELQGDASLSVGIGDAFSAVSLFGLIRGWLIEQTLVRPHRVCRLRGAIPDSDDFYHPFITEWQFARVQTT